MALVPSGGGCEEEEEEEDEEEATQRVIELSLAQRHKLTQLDSRVLSICPEREKISTAIKHGDERRLRELTVHQSVFSEEDDGGFIPLHEAATQSNISILHITLTASARDCLRRRTAAGKTALLLAVEKGLLVNTALLLDSGSSADVMSEDEETPLTLAVRNSQYALVKLLLSAGAPVDQQGAHLRTALHEAARLGLPDVVDLLLEFGAQPDRRSSFGLTPLALAAQAGHLQVVRKLLQKGADVRSQAQDSASILFEACASGNPEVISELLEHGADANVPKHTGHLPIHRAAHRGHTRAVCQLIPVTASEAVCESGMSPLHAAAAGAHSECVRVLLAAGFDPNAMLSDRVRRNYDDQRQSALFFAVSNDDLESARMLLEAGATPNCDPVKCLQVALRLGNHHLLHALLRHGANVNYFSQVNSTHFPSALQYALKDELVLRMLCNYGYEVQRCFYCPYGDGSHVPQGYEGWSDTVIKDTLFCEVITLSWLKHLSGQVVRILLDYVDHVTLCAKLRQTLSEQKQWSDICRIQGSVRCLQHLCRLRIRSCLGRLRLRAPVFMSFLPLPETLKRFILYAEFDLYCLRYQSQEE